MHKHARTHELSDALWQRHNWQVQLSDLRDDLRAIEAVKAYPRNVASFELWTRLNRHNILPAEGGWLDQPAWFVDDCKWLDLQQMIYDLELAIEKFIPPKR